MKTPVVIAAHNEERLIGKCLKNLQTDVEPIVVANGCEDDTVAIAETFGVQVVDLPEAGKLPAIQHALRLLGSRALEPVLYTDADSFPRFTRSWANIMTESVSGTDGAQCASGPLGYFDGNPISDLTRTVKRAVDVRRVRQNGGTKMWGNNMATRFDEETLDVVLTLPHIWPGEDRAIEMKIEESGGNSTQVTHPLATVFTSSRFMLPLNHIAKVGTDAASQEKLHDYWDRAAPGSIRLRDYLANLDNQNS